MTDSNDVMNRAEEAVDHTRREARRHARQPSAVVAFVAAYMLFAAARIIVRFNEQWYEGLEHPRWVLPMVAQEVAWFIAFGLLALSTVQMVRKASGTTTGSIVFGLRVAHFVALQLYVILLFGAQDLVWAAVDATALALLAFAAAFTAQNRTATAAWLLGTYAVWASYSAAATWGLWFLNR